MDKEEVIKPFIIIKYPENNQIQQYEYDEKKTIEDYLKNALTVFRFL